MVHLLVGQEGSFFTVMINRRIIMVYHTFKHEYRNVVNAFYIVGQGVYDSLYKTVHYLIALVY